MNHPGVEDKRGWRTWLKGLGVAGFVFFLVKGLLWLAVVVLIVLFGIEIGSTA
ncbi:MAG: hypothetical protein ACE10E_09370 [Acidiferrobacterales bacterium]|nr:hypothetical protein [Gammaproteobacteria bacterium]